mmetsp:Transcript_50059/g.73090  ORF Transcript_50059/g.73090 Transcript_50059/m.73090 type:complete len:80 (+) Transcript_50059:92-331(+)
MPLRRHQTICPMTKSCHTHKTLVTKSKNSSAGEAYVLQNSYTPLLIPFWQHGSGIVGVFVWMTGHNSLFESLKETFWLY